MAPLISQTNNVIKYLHWQGLKNQELLFLDSLTQEDSVTRDHILRTNACERNILQMFLQMFHLAKP